jgi:hypothetical protein
MSKRNTRGKKSASKIESRLAAEGASVQRDEPDGPLFRGKLDDLQFQAYERAVAYVRHRASEFGDDFKDGPPKGSEFQQGVGDYAPRPIGLQGIQDIAGLFYTLFGLVYISADLEEEHWGQSDLASFLELIPFDLTSQIRAMSCICEGFNIDSAPLAKLAYEWGSTFRDSASVVESLRAFASRVPPDRLVEIASPTIQRVLRRTEFQWSTAVQSMQREQPAGPKQSKRESKQERQESTKGAKRGVTDRRRHRENLGPEWAYLADLGREHPQISKSTLHYYMRKLDPNDRRRDRESKERVVRREPYLSVLEEMGKLNR